MGNNIGGDQTAMIFGKAPLCECGCGNPVNRHSKGRCWNRFLHGHTWKGKVGPTKGKKIKSPPIWFGEKQRVRMLDSNPMKNPDVAKRNGEVRRGRTKENNSAVRRMSETKKGKSKGPHTEETKRKIGDGNRGKRKGKTYEELFGLIKAAEWKANLHKATWGNDDFVARQMVSRKVSPNKLELQFIDILNQLYLGEYKYVGDGQVIIAGKCPDFINVNGQKKIIELFGDYWHRNDDPLDRIDIFKPYGYNALVVWESELRNSKRVKNKLRLFHESRDL